jgi:hypothetical protein
MVEPEAAGVPGVTEGTEGTAAAGVLRHSIRAFQGALADPAEAPEAGPRGAPGAMEAPGDLHLVVPFTIRVYSVSTMTRSS